MAKLILAVAIVLALCAQLGTPAPQDRDLGDKVKETVNDEINRIFGGQCEDDQQCSVISHCSKQNTCMVNWWVILIIVALICLLLFAFCSCICCPCCCLYQCCESICCCC